MEHDPMCSVPVSYLNMLQGRAADQQPYTIKWDPNGVMQTPAESHPAEKMGTIAKLTDERDRLRTELALANDRIAAFEERAGCALEHIPVEKLNAAQDAHVMQSAVDELKRENERLSKECNALGSELCDWRGKFKEAERKLAGAPEPAPYGLRKDGTPKAKPGRKVPRRRKAA